MPRQRRRRRVTPPAKNQEVYYMNGNGMSDTTLLFVKRHGAVVKEAQDGKFIYYQIKGSMVTDQFGPKRLYIKNAQQEPSYGFPVSSIDPLKDTGISWVEPESKTKLIEIRPLEEKSTGRRRRRRKR